MIQTIKDGYFMLKMSDVPIERFLPIFASAGIDVAFLVPTPNGYTKSIMDATAPVRDFLLKNDIHDYTKQQQGTDYKVKYSTYFVYKDRLEETTASLYRPVTKQGDPRIWFTSLKEYCSPCNLLAIITDKKSLYVLNLSDTEIFESILHGGMAAQVIQNAVEIEDQIANELLVKLNGLHKRGFIPSIVGGDTGVGMTLEHYLGISPNASKLPDYRGIELKASRTTTRQSNRVNLFSQVPDWKSSRGMTAERLLNEYGYWADDHGVRRFNLYCTVEAHTPNSQGLYFETDTDKDMLVNFGMKKDVSRYVLQWDLAVLRQRLLEKHHETFWVKATSIFDGGQELFKYDSIVRTKKPNATLFGYLMDSRVITMDYTMHFKENGKVRDHGYLFKIRPENVNLLFPEPLKYELK